MPETATHSIREPGRSLTKAGEYADKLPEPRPVSPIDPVIGQMTRLEHAVASLYSIINPQVNGNSRVEPFMNQLRSASGIKEQGLSLHFSTHDNTEGSLYISADNGATQVRLRCWCLSNADIYLTKGTENKNGRIAEDEMRKEVCFIKADSSSARVYTLDGKSICGVAQDGVLVAETLKLQAYNRNLKEYNHKVEQSTTFKSRFSDLLNRYSGGVLGSKIEIPVIPAHPAIKTPADRLLSSLCEITDLLNKATAVLAPSGVST